MSCFRHMMFLLVRFIREEFPISLTTAVISALPRWHMARCLESERVDGEDVNRGGVTHAL